MIFHFSIVQVHFFLLIEFIVLFPFLIKYYCVIFIIIVFSSPTVDSEWIISVGDYVDNSFTALGSSDPRAVRLEL